MARAKKGGDWTPSFLRHRALMATEAVLVVGCLKGLMEGWVKASALPGYAKVIFIMAGTVGLLGGMYWVIERMTRSSVERAHGMAAGDPRVVTRWSSTICAMP
jgi:hypothetical protein